MKLPGPISLPPEIVDEILSIISIRDCHNITKAYRIPALDPQSDVGKKLHDHINRRKSPLAYLGNYFRNPKELIGAMIKSGVVISGSRALNFFVGDACTPESDWDFYIPKDYQGIYDFMKYMETSQQTVWHPTISTFEDKIYGSIQPVNVTQMELERVISVIGGNEAHKTTTNIAEGILLVIVSRSGFGDDIDRADLAEESAIRRSGRKGIHIKHNFDTNVYEVAFGTHTSKLTINGADEYIGNCIICGTMTYGSINTKVQVIICDASVTGPLKKISRFDLSITQSFISGFGSVHMYADDAYNKRIRAQDGIDMGANRSWVKYTLRGYKTYIRSVSRDFDEYATNEFTRRIIGDSGCHCIDFVIKDRKSSYYDDIKAKTRLYNFSWLETQCGMHEDFFVNQAMRESYILIRDKYKHTDFVSENTLKKVANGSKSILSTPSKTCTETLSNFI